MQLAYSSLYCSESAKNGAVDSRDSNVKNIINDVHLVHPFFVNTRIPKELHHDNKLSQLRYLTQKDEA